MFKQFKNIDSAFKYIRSFSMCFLACSTALNIYTIKRCTSALAEAKQKIYVLASGKLMDAYAINRSDSIVVEIRDHVKTFHYDFYSLQPDETVNRKHLIAALYLADNSVQQEYDSLTYKGYYSGIVSDNIIQEVLDYDSISVDLNQAPYHFIYYGKIKMTRDASIVTRSLITEGYIRVLPTVSDHNPHGFLIERWKVLENRGLSIEKK
jgi:conjugative transposon TraK protein